MKVDQILKFKISNFRNLKMNVLDFNSKINLVYGNNGNGKTNLLEAIFFILTKKYFKKKCNFLQVLNIDGDDIFIESQILFRNDKINYTSSMKISNNILVRYVNNKIFKKKIESYPLFINPFDFYLFHQHASNRRIFFDEKFSLIDKEYKKILKNLNIIIKQRNKLLSEKSFDYLKQIEILDIQLLIKSEIITKKRIEYLKLLKNCFELTFNKLFAINSSIEIKLQTKQNNLKIIMLKNLTKDIKSGITNYSILRDDYIIYYNQLNSIEFCSFGQQKMIYLALQFSFIELFKSYFNFSPILLIDDISGELDKIRWNNLITYLIKSNFQTFITTANEDFKNMINTFQNEKIKEFNICDGMIN